MHIIIVYPIKVGRQHIIQVLAIQTERSPVTLLVMLGIASVHLQCPRLLAALGDDVDHASRGLAAIESRGRPFHDLDALHVVHVEPSEIHVVHGLASQSLSIHEEKHPLPTKAREVEVSLLIHRIRELHTGQLLLQEVLHIGSVQLGQLLGVDYTSLNGHILQELRSAGARHHHLVKIKLNTDRIPVSLEGQ